MVCPFRSAIRPANVLRDDPELQKSASSRALNPRVFIPHHPFNHLFRGTHVENTIAGMKQLMISVITHGDPKKNASGPTTCMYTLRYGVWRIGVPHGRVLDAFNFSTSTFVLSWAAGSEQAGKASLNQNWADVRACKLGKFGRFDRICSAWRNLKRVMLL